MADFTNTAVNQTAAPEPMSLTLFGMGLMELCGGAASDNHRDYLASTTCRDARDRARQNSPPCREHCADLIPTHERTIDPMAIKSLVKTAAVAVASLALAGCVHKTAYLTKSPAQAGGEQQIAHCEGEASSPWYLRKSPTTIA